MPSPESINLGQQEGGIKPPEIKTPQQLEIEKFDGETLKLRGREKYLQSQISETQKKLEGMTGINLPFKGPYETAIVAFQKDLQETQEEINKREPSPEEINIQKQIQDAEAAKKLRVAEGQQGQEDIDPNYEAQMDGLKKDLEAAKLARIKKIQTAEAGAPEKPQEQPEQSSREIKEEVKEEQPQPEAPKAAEVVESKPQAPKSEGELKQDDLKNQLEVYLEMLNAGKAGKMEGGNAPYRYAREAFRELTGEDLEATAEERAETEFTYNGKVRLREGAEGDKYKAERLEEIKSIQRLQSAKEAFTRLSPKEQTKYGTAQEYAATVLEPKLQELNGKGIKISRESFYQMINEQFRPEDMERRTGLGKLFRGAIRIGRFLKLKPWERNNSNMSEESFQIILDAGGKKFNADASQRLEEELKKEEQDFQQIKERHMRDLMVEAVNGTFPVKKAEAAAEPAVAQAPEAPAAPAEEAPAVAGPEAPMPEEAASPEVTSEQAEMSKMEEIKGKVTGAADMQELISIMKAAIKDYGKETKGKAKKSERKMKGVKTAKGKGRKATKRAKISKIARSKNAA